MVVAVVVEPQQPQGVEDDQHGGAFVDEYDRSHRQPEQAQEGEADRGEGDQPGVDIGHPTVERAAEEG